MAPVKTSTIAHINTALNRLQNFSSKVENALVAKTAIIL